MVMGSILVLGGVGFTVKEVVETARKVTGHPIPAKEEPRRAGDPSMLIASSAKAREVLGWNPQYADLETIPEGDSSHILHLPDQPIPGSIHTPQVH